MNLILCGSYYVCHTQQSVPYGFSTKTLKFNEQKQKPRNRNLARVKIIKNYNTKRRFEIDITLNLLAQELFF